MLVNKLIKWIPAEGLSEKYELDLISGAAGQVEIILIDVLDATKKIKIDPNGLVISCIVTRRCLKGNLLKISGISYESEEIGAWTFFQITNSTGVDSLCRESYDFYQPDMFAHFVIITPSEFIEFFTGPSRPPTVTFL